MTTTKRYVVSINHDPDTENPADDCCTWKPYSFSNRHINFKHPNEFFEDGKAQDWLAEKLKVGLAFLLSYYEHSLGMWYIAGSKYVPDAQWDNVDCAGVLVWEHKEDEIGGKTVEERKADAAAFLECYTDWCNGNCHCYAIEEEESEDDEDGEGTWTRTKHIDSCGGFIGDYIVEAIREALPKDATEENTTIEGDTGIQLYELFKKD